MIPANAFTPTPNSSAFISPYNLAYTPLSQTVLGGTAIGDGAAGRQVKNWTATFTGSAIEVAAVGDAPSFTLAVTDVQSVSLAFDNNMGVVLAWMTTGGANLYYFNTVTSSYTTEFFSGVTSCRVVVDDAREFNTANSDVIFGYTKAGSLYWRQQRDRYQIERLIGTTTKKLKRMGPNTLNRLQFELR